MIVQKNVQKIVQQEHWVFRMLDSSLVLHAGSELKKEKNDFRNTFAPILLLETALFDNAE